MSHCGFNLYFYDDWCAYLPDIYFLLSSFALFIKLTCLLIIRFSKFFTYSGYKFFVGYVTCKYFLPGCTLSFHSLNSVFLITNIFNFDEALIYHFFLLQIVLEGLWIFIISRFISFTKFWKSLVILSSDMFPAPTHSPPPETDNMSVRLPRISSQIPTPLYIFLDIIFPLFLKLNYSYWLFFKNTYPSSHLDSTFESSQWVFIFWLLYFTDLKFPFFSSLYFLPLCWDFSLSFYLFQNHFPFLIRAFSSGF